MLELDCLYSNTSFWLSLSTCEITYYLFTLSKRVSPLIMLSFNHLKPTKGLDALSPPHARAVVEVHPCPGASSPMAEVELPCGRGRVSPTPPSACAPQARCPPLRVRPKPDASLSACALSLTPLLVRLRRSSSLAPRSSSPGSGGLSFFLCSYRKGLVVRWR